MPLTPTEEEEEDIEAGSHLFVAHMRGALLGAISSMYLVKAYVWPALTETMLFSTPFMRLIGWATVIAGGFTAFALLKFSVKFQQYLEGKNELEASTEAKLLTANFGLALYSVFILRILLSPYFSPSSYDLLYYSLGAFSLALGYQAKKFINSMLVGEQTHTKLNGNDSPGWQRVFWNFTWGLTLTGMLWSMGLAETKVMNAVPAR